MDEWIDAEEKARRQREADYQKYLGRLAKDIRWWERFYLMELFLCGVNAGFALRFLILGWAVNPWYLAGALASAIAAGSSGRTMILSRRRAKTLRVLRANSIAALAAKNPGQLIFYADQVEAAFKRL
jgi:hypothetical protein